MRASKRYFIIFTILTLGLLTGSATLWAGGAGGDDAAQANNPLANFKSFAAQGYYLGNLSDIKKDDDAQQYWLRYAQPVDRWIVRASLPINHFPTSPNGNADTGLGNFNIFGAYTFDIGKPGVSFGAGPLLTVPTSTNGMDSDKWSAGFANVLFDASSKAFQYGYLLTWQGSFAGPSNAEYVNVGAVQPFAFLQMGSGWYLRAAPIWMYNFHDDSYTVPVGVGIGKVIIHNDAVLNFYVEPQYSIFDNGPGLPEWQVLFGCNLQLKGN